MKNHKTKSKKDVQTFFFKVALLVKNKNTQQQNKKSLPDLYILRKTGLLKFLYENML